MSIFIPPPDDSMTILPSIPSTPSTPSNIEGPNPFDRSAINVIRSEIGDTISDELVNIKDIINKVENFFIERKTNIQEFISFIKKHGQKIYDYVRKINLLPSIKTEIEQLEQFTITDLITGEITIVNEIKSPPTWWLFDLNSFDEYLKNKTNLPTDIISFKPSIKNFTVLFNSIKLIIGEFLELITNKLLDFFNSTTLSKNIIQAIKYNEFPNLLPVEIFEVKSNMYNLVYYLKTIIYDFVNDSKFFDLVLRFFINIKPDVLLESILNFFKNYLSFLNPRLFSRIISFFSFSFLIVGLAPTGIGEAIFFYGGLFIFITSIIHSFVILKNIFQPQIDYIFNFIRDTTKPINDNMKSDFNIICQNMYNTFSNMSFI
jgi:hypothetical protein